MIFLKHRISPPKSILLISTGIFRMSLGELSKWKKCLFSNICSSEDCYYTTSPASHHPNDHNVSQKWDPPLSSNIVFDARRPMAVMGQRSRLVFTKISHFKWERNVWCIQTWARQNFQEGDRIWCSRGGQNLKNFKRGDWKNPRGGLGPFFGDQNFSN